MTHKYRVVGASPQLQEVLDKLAGKKPSKPQHTSYSGSDILAAKTVLDRLLAMSTRNEVSYVSKVTRELDET